MGYKYKNMFMISYNSRNLDVLWKKNVCQVLACVCPGVRNVIIDASPETTILSHLPLSPFLTSISLLRGVLHFSIPLSTQRTDTAYGLTHTAPSHPCAVRLVT